MSSYNNNIRSSRSSSSSSSYARPRSVYSSPSRAGGGGGTGSLYSSFGRSAPYLNASSYSSGVPSAYSSPSYSPSTYGGTASGYGGLTITPSSSTASLSSYSAGRTASPLSRQSHRPSPSIRQPHVSSSTRQPHVSPSTRQPHAPIKRNYYQSPLSRFDSSTSLASSKSYGSEGYVVRTGYNEVTV